MTTPASITTPARQYHAICLPRISLNSRMPHAPDTNSPPYKMGYANDKPIRRVAMMLDTLARFQIMPENIPGTAA